MDDGDGALPIEMMAGMPSAAILQTVYNGSSVCPGCGGLLSPIVTLFSGGLCPECQTERIRKGFKNLTGR